MECRICSVQLGPSPVKVNAIISPWIRELASIKQLASKLIYCKNCKGAFFSYAYSKNQMHLIYNDYRGLNYIKIRNKWEKWYTTEYNDAHTGEQFIEKRKKVILDFISSSIKIKDINTLVDVGGDRGQFIPEINSLKNRYVLDFSNQLLTTGVQRLNDLSQVKDIDLIIYAHVLEHVSEPILELNQLLNSSKHVYVEVPYGIPARNRLRRSFSVFILSLAVSRFPILWSKFSKTSAGRVQTASLLRQSEHLNFFLPETFHALSRKVGVECVTEICTIPTPDKTTIKVIQVLFSKI